jgi:hypothetical protein
MEIIEAHSALTKKPMILKFHLKNERVRCGALQKLSAGVYIQKSYEFVSGYERCGLALQRIRFNGHEDWTGGILGEICAARSDSGHLNFDLTGAGTGLGESGTSTTRISFLPYQTAARVRIFSFLINRL